MSRILFVMLHPGFIRYYDDAVQALAADGHHVHIAVETSRDKLGDSALAQRMSDSSPLISFGGTPPRVESVRDFLVRRDRTAMRSSDGRGVGRRRDVAWESLATTVRLALDYLRFFEPRFAHAGKLRDRAEKRLPPVYVPPLRAAAAAGGWARRALSAVLRGVENAIPVGEALESYVRQQQPDLLLVTPLIELGSQQVDYVKCARHLGIRSALCVASWDNLTSKGLIRVVPDHVVVWNEAQKAEATTLHGVPSEGVTVTGAQVFDRWFSARPSRSREAFCQDLGLDPARPFVLYVGSSVFIAPEEVSFTERWLSRLRHSAHPEVSSLGVLVRPHPANARQWRTFDAHAWPNVALWPTGAGEPSSADARRDYFDSLFHSAAVVGINTSAQIEAGIIGRPVFTMCTPEFAHSQEGTLHFQHLVNPTEGVVRAAATIDDHLDQLREALLHPERVADANRRFVRAFVRPLGEDVPAVPEFARAIASLAARGGPAPRPAGAGAGIARPFVYVLAWVARGLAEDRPLWVHALRPFVTATVWAAAWAYRVRRGARERGHLAAKLARRRLHRTWYKSTRASERWWKRVRGRARRALAFAHGIHRRH